MRPIDADKLADRFKASPVFRNMGYEGNFLLVIVLDLLGNAPTADVVPLEEVHHLRHILDDYAIQYGTAKDQHAVIKRIKAEVAREIFAEIEPCHAIGDFTGDKVYYAIRVEDYNKCKKKYTEDTTDGKRTDR